jgi:hypothetical protein
MNFNQFKNIASQTTLDEDLIYQSDMTILSEAIHAELQDILDREHGASTKLNEVARRARHLIASGQDTGFADDKPKKGSSRAVFFPKEPKKIILDGKETYLPTAVKIAFPGKLDKYTGDSMLLGEHQNQLEADHHIQRHYGMLIPVGHNQYETNPNGVLAPVMESHPDHHYLEMGHCSAYNAKDLREHTKDARFKKGISHAELQEHMLSEYRSAHGESHYGSGHPDLIHSDHANNMIDAMHSMGLHPGDLSPRNMGIWTHPHTGHKHPVILDYGFSTDIANLYSRARRKMYYNR